MKLDKFLKKDIDYTELFRAIEVTHKLTINVSHFIKMYIIYLYDWNLPIPTINEDFVRIVYKALSIPSLRGRQMTYDNAKFYDSFILFKNMYFSNIAEYSD